jgi:hypothetical protein
MDVCLDLAIPKIVSDAEFQFHEELVNWGDEQFSQDPPRYIGQGAVALTKRPMPDHIKRFLPRDLDISGWEYLSFDVDALDLWERVINNSHEKIDEIPLKKFLFLLLKRLDSWVVIFELNCDQIDNVYRLTQSELLLKIEDILNWNNKPEGFIAWNNQPRDL